MFLPEKIDAAISLGRELDIYSRIANNPDMIPSTQFYIGIDAGFGSSKFAIVLKCVVDDNIFILETIELDRQEFNYCINRISELMMQYDLTQDNTKVLIDASSPSVVMAVKKSLDELSDYLETISRRKKQKIRDPYYDMCVLPINFNSSEKRNMLANLKDLIDSNTIALDLERHYNLVLALRTAKDMDLILDK